MSERKIATVFGGSGFLGRHVVQRLAARGYTVRVAVRDTEAAMFLRPMGGSGEIVPLYAPAGVEADVARAVQGAEIVVNLVGILAERRKGDFQRVHVEGATRIARLAATANVRHLIHVSAIGADAASPSEYARTKAAGEAALRAAFPRAVVLRPSILFGAEDNFFNRFASMAVLSLVIPIVSGKTKFQPVYVGDVADAVIASLAPAAQSRIFELGGPEVKTFHELVALMLEIIGRPRLILDLPPGVAKFQALVLEHLPGKLLTRDQIALLGRDNIVAPFVPDLATLGLTPTPMSLILPAYLARYRPTGGSRATRFQL
ncbi:MAG: complex I NDUFA9 subunit family protein [Acidocella sp.]|nr:complex I NDUFA9 subunit family protein [Acidocella sp.]